MLPEFFWRHGEKDVGTRMGFYIKKLRTSRYFNSLVLAQRAMKTF